MYIFSVAACSSLFPLLKACENTPSHKVVHPLQRLFLCIWLELLLREMKRTKAVLTPSGIENTLTAEHPASGGPSISDILGSLQVTIQSSNREELVVDIAGIEAPFANAIRRILLSEVPTMAIEHVNLYQNTSVIPDEVLAHRLGLIPIAVDPRAFQYREKDEPHSENNSIHFVLHVHCRRNPAGEVVKDKVYTSDFVWKPVGNQREMLTDVRPVHEDILIALLSPGQEIEAELICEKGIGQTHAKWSPVATASYRMLPLITLKNSTPQQATELKSLCPVGVFDIEQGVAIVKYPRNCTSCRECLKTGLVEVAKHKEHFICKK